MQATDYENKQVEDNCNFLSYEEKQIIARKNII